MEKLKLERLRGSMQMAVYKSIGKQQQISGVDQMSALKVRETLRGTNGELNL